MFSDVNIEFQQIFQYGLTYVYQNVYLSFYACYLIIYGILDMSSQYYKEEGELSLHFSRSQVSV